MFFFLGRNFLTFYFKESPDIVLGGAHTNQEPTLTDYKHLQKHLQEHLQEHLQTESKNIAKYQEQHSSKDGLGANALINLHSIISHISYMTLWILG